MPDPEGSSVPFGDEVLDWALPIDDELENCEVPLSCPLVTMRGDNQDCIRPRGLFDYSIKVGRAGVSATHGGYPSAALITRGLFHSQRRDT